MSETKRFRVEVDKSHNNITHVRTGNKLWNVMGGGSNYLVVTDIPFPPPPLKIVVDVDIERLIPCDCWGNIIDKPITSYKVPIDMKNIKKYFKIGLLDYLKYWEILLNSVFNRKGMDGEADSFGETLSYTFIFIFCHIGIYFILFFVATIAPTIASFTLSFALNNISEIIVGIILIGVIRNKKDLLAARYRAFKAKLENW